MSVATLDPSTPICFAKERLQRRLLLIAYSFPPVGGAGVQRPVKWVKYLRQWGWDVTVLTTLNPSVPVRDESLLSDLPKDVNVVRARTWEPDYRVKQTLINPSSQPRRGILQSLKGTIRNAARSSVKLALQPDPQVLWNHQAIKAGKRILHAQPHDAILVTAPPYSSFFIGAALKKRFGLPLVLDYRDEWDLSGKYLENAQRDWFSRSIQERMQQRLLKQADAVVATTQRSTEAIAEKLRALGHSIPNRCIYNGFDAEDFEHDDEESQPAIDLESVVRQPDPGTFRLVYTGTLWNLTDIEPLVCGIQKLNAAQPELARKLELVCVGRKTPDQQTLLNRLLSTEARVESIDYCDHSTALKWLRSASGLSLLLSDVPGAERVVPAKLFEYLAVKKDILTISPAGETADIIRRFFPQGHYTPNDVSGIAEWLEQRLAATKSGSQTLIPAEGDFQEFSRKSQTGKLADLLNGLVQTREFARSSR